MLESAVSVLLSCCCRCCCKGRVRLRSCRSLKWSRRLKGPTTSTSTGYAILGTRRAILHRSALGHEDTRGWFLQSISDRTRLAKFESICHGLCRLVIAVWTSLLHRRLHLGGNAAYTSQNRALQVSVMEMLTLREAAYRASGAINNGQMMSGWDFARAPCQSGRGAGRLTSRSVGQRSVKSSLRTLASQVTVAC